MAGKAQDVAKPASEGTVIRPTGFSAMVRKMGQIASLEETMGGTGGNEDIERILAASDEEEMWDSDELAKWNATKLSGCDLQTVGFEVRLTEPNEEIRNPFIDPDTGKPMFLLIHSFRVNNAGNVKEYNLPPIGEVFTWNTSARNIIPKFMWMLAHGWFDDGAKPVRFRIVGTKTKAGSVEKLKALPPNTVIEASAPIATEPATEEPPF